VQGTRRTDTTYSAKLTFGYKVNGRDYSTQTVQFGRALGSGDFSEAAVLLLQYPPGTRVDIHHHPADPSIAVVKPGVNVEVILYLVVGLALLGLAPVAGFAYLAVTRDVSLGRHAFSLVWLVFVFLGLGMLVPGLQNMRHAYASPSWPTTRGVIVFADTNAETSVTRDEGGYAVESTAHRAALAYRYEIDGKQHFSNVRRFGQFKASSKPWAEEILERYPSGANVPVHYCPTDPDLAVLEPGIGSQAYYLPGAGAAFVLVGLLATILSWK
jgi:hypothetical protein